MGLAPRASDSACLGRGLELCIPHKSQAMLRQLVWGPHLESLLVKCHEKVKSRCIYSCFLGIGVVYVMTF